ncbi:MAG: class I SAM-dependent methyltransferase [Candidatus Gracilibacteria bacterium]
MGGYKQEYGIALDTEPVMLERFDDMQRRFKSEEQAGDGIWKRLVYGLQALGRTDLLKEPKVLEVGCFEAQLLRYLLRQEINAVGIDTDPRHVGIVPGKIFHMDAERTDFHDGEFDIAITDGIFDKYLYANDDDRILRELARIIKPGGVLYIHEIEWLAKSLLPNLERYKDLFEVKVANKGPRSESVVLLVRRDLEALCEKSELVIELRSFQRSGSMVLEGYPMPLQKLALDLGLKLEFVGEEGNKFMIYTPDGSSFERFLKRAGLNSKNKLRKLGGEMFFVACGRITDSKNGRGYFTVNKIGRTPVNGKS